MQQLDGVSDMPVPKQRQCRITNQIDPRLPCNEPFVKDCKPLNCFT